MLGFVARRDDEYFELAIAIVVFAKVHFPPFLGRWRVSRDYFLVLAFPATHSEMALRSVLSDSEGKMEKLSMYELNSQKVRMDYSCYGRY